MCFLHKALQLTQTVKSISRVHRYYRRQLSSYSHPSTCQVYVWDRRVIFLKKRWVCWHLSARCPLNPAVISCLSRMLPASLSQMKSRSQCHLIAVSANRQWCLRLPPTQRRRNICFILSLPWLLNAHNPFLYDGRWIESLCLSVTEYSHLAPCVTWFSGHMAPRL